MAAHNLFNMYAHEDINKQEVLINCVIDHLMNPSYKFK